MKRCFKCGVEKELDEYYKHPQMGDGHLGKCKECTKRDVRANRVNRLDYYREYDRVRFRDNPATREQHRRSLDKHRENNPQKARARVRVGHAIRRGTMVSKPCELCGAKKTQAHHTDYSKPLHVRWLCKRCHDFVHAPLLLPYYPHAA